VVGLPRIALGVDIGDKVTQSGHLRLELVDLLVRTTEQGDQQRAADCMFHRYRPRVNPSGKS
jgi:hypothetical protein